MAYCDSLDYICKTIENVNNIADNSLHISSMLPVTCAIKSDILHLYLQAVDVYINVSDLPYMQSIPVLANCHG